jgi:replicative DNA helicase
MRTEASRANESQPINPTNLAAERAVLGALIENNAILPEALRNGLLAKHFALSDHRRLFEAILALHMRKLPIDYILVAEELGNRAEDYALVARLIEGVVVESDHVLHHVAIIKRKARLRALLRLGEWLTEIVNDTSDPDALIQEATQRIEGIAKDGPQ